MIYDTIANAAAYKGIDPRIDDAIDLLMNTDFLNAGLGKHEVNENMYYNVMQYQPTPGSKLEAHDVYADLQAVISGHEYMGVRIRSELGEPVQVGAPGNNDICFYGEDYDRIRMTPGTFILLLPQDAHAPGDADEEGVDVRRVIIKIKLK